MKKLLLLFAVLLFTVGAWAQNWSYATNVVVGNKITNISTIEDGQPVLFKHVARGEYIVLDANADADLTSSLSGLCVFKLHKGEGENATKFTIESSKEGFYFPEIQHNGGWKDYVMSETPVYYEFLSEQADKTALPSGQFVVKCASTSGYFDGGLNKSSKPDFTAWEGKGNNSKYEIYAVNVYDFSDASVLTPTGFYTLQCPNKSNVYAKYDGNRITYVAQDKKDYVNCVFYFERGEGNRYTIRLIDGRYLTYKGTGQGDQIEIKRPSEINDNNKWWQMYPGKESGRVVILPNQNNITTKTPGFNFAVRYKKEGDATEDTNGALGLWDCDDNNSQWIIAPTVPMLAEGVAKIKVQNIFLKKDGDYLKKGGDTDFELFTLTKDATKNRYTIQTSDGTYLTYAGTGNDTQVAFAEPTDANKWWIIEYNNGPAAGAVNPVDIYPYVDSFDKNNAAWNFAITVGLANNEALGLWSAGDDNSYCELLWEIENVLTDEAQNVYSRKYYGLAGFLDPSFSGVAGYTLNNQYWRANQFIADIIFPLPVSKVDGSTDNLVLITPFTSTNSLKYYVEGENVRVSSETLTSTVVDNYQWAVYPYFIDNAFAFVLKNYATQKYVKVNKTESTAVTNDSGAVTVVKDIKDATYFTIESDCRFKVPNAEVRMSVTSSSTSPQDVTVHTGHGGCNTYYTIVSDVVNNWKNYNIANLGSVGCYSADSREDILAVQSYSQMLAYIEQNKETVALVPGYYLIKGTGDGHASNKSTWYVTYDSNQNLKAVTPAQGEKLGTPYIWRLESSDEGKYKLYSCNIGKYSVLKGAPDPSPITGTADACDKYVLTDTGSGKFQIKSDGGKNFRTEGDGTINEWGSESNETWHIIPATELDITITNAGWATTCLPFDVVLPEELTAYALTGVDNVNGEETGTVSLISKAGIPAKQGALLNGAPGTYTLSIEETASNWEANMLSGTTVAKDMSTLTGDVYLLTADGENSAKLSKLVLAVDATEAKKTLAANKAYLHIATSSARFLVFNFDEDNETAIESIGSEEGNMKEEIFDLAGRRVQKAQKGLYIVNGQKVIK